MVRSVNQKIYKCTFTTNEILLSITTYIKHN